MFGNAVLFVHCKLLLHKELVLPYQVTLTWRETEIHQKRKWTHPNLSVSCFKFFHFHFISVFRNFSFPLKESKFFN